MFAEASLQADAEAITQMATGSCGLSSAVSKDLPMLLLFHTLLPSEILDKHHLFAPGNYCTFFSFAVHSCCCRGFAVLQGFVRMASPGTSPVPRVATAELQVCPAMRAGTAVISLDLTL